MNTLGVVIWVILAALTMIVSIKVEKVKKDNDIQTYKEITAFMSGETLDSPSKAEETGKRNYQKFVYALGSAVITLIIVLVTI